MADVIEQPAVQPEQSVVDEGKALLDKQMQIALNNGRTPQGQQLPVSTETKEEQPIVVEQPPVADTASLITFDSLKDKFAYEKPEDAIKEIEEYRKIKENPIPETKFENEQSKKLFEAIKGGKQKEAYAILAEQEKIESLTSVEVNKNNAADIIKLGMQIKYKDLTPAEIDYKFKKQFALPKEPVQGVTEETEEFEQRVNEWKIQVSDIEMDKILEAKFVKPDIESHKQKLVLPEIEAEVDEDYIQWKKAQEIDPQIEAERLAELKSFTPKSIETKLPFNDEANKVAFEFQFQPSDEDFTKTVEMATDISKFYNLFRRPDGSPDRKSFVQALYFAANREKAITEAMNQAKNATIKAMIPPTGGGVVRQLPQQQQNMGELDEKMRQAGVVR